MTDTPLDKESLIRTHARNYHGFTLGVKWFLIHLAVLLSFLVVSFATPAGWGWGVVIAVVVFCIGVWSMNHGLNHSTEANSLGEPRREMGLGRIDMSP